MNNIPHESISKEIRGFSTEWSISQYKCPNRVTPRKWKSWTLLIIFLSGRKPSIHLRQTLIHGQLCITGELLSRLYKMYHSQFWQV